MLRNPTRLAAVAALVCLHACVGHSGVRPLRPLELATAPYTPVISSSMTGSLGYEGDCLLFRDDETKAMFFPIWPLGSTFNGTSVTFHEPARAEQRVVIGEELVISGASAAWPSLDPVAYAPFHHQCGATPFFVRRVGPAN